jgi:hypothetical protein
MITLGVDVCCTIVRRRGLVDRANPRLSRDFSGGELIQESITAAMNAYALLVQ